MDTDRILAGSRCLYSSPFSLQIFIKNDQIFKVTTPFIEMKGIYRFYEHIIPI